MPIILQLKKLLFFSQNAVHTNMIARINTKIETEEMEITEAIENMSSRTFFSTKKALNITNNI